MNTPDSNLEAGVCSLSHGLFRRRVLRFAAQGFQIRQNRVEFADHRAQLVVAGGGFINLDFAERHGAVGIHVRVSVGKRDVAGAVRLENKAQVFRFDGPNQKLLIHAAFVGFNAFDVQRGDLFPRAIFETAGCRLHLNAARPAQIALV